MGRYFCTFLISGWAVVSQLAQAYPTPVDFDGTLLRWDIGRTDPPVLYKIQSDNDTNLLIYEQAVVDAAEMWNDVTSSYFQYAPAGKDETPQVTIMLQTALANAPFSAGYAIFDEISDEGKPVHCSIYLGLDVHNSYIDVAKTAMHELGHCFGLGHSLVPEAIMGYQLDKNSFELDIDDRAAITRLYPADGSNPAVPPGCSVGWLHQPWISIFFWGLPLLLGWRKEFSPA